MSLDTSVQGQPLILVRSTLGELSKGAEERLEPGGLRVVLVDDDAAMTAAIDEYEPDIILLAFPATEPDALPLCERVHQHPGANGVPILMTADVDSEAAIADAYRAGATEVIPTPIRWTLLTHLIQQLLKVQTQRQALENGRRHLQDTQRIAGVGSWSWDFSGESMEWSDQTYAILGMDPEITAPTFESFSLCMHESDRDQTVAQIKAALEQGHPFQVAYRIAVADSSVRYVQLRGELPGAGEQRALGTVQDVSEQRRVEERIQFLADYDSLTGLSNRRRFREELERAIQRAKAKNHTMALIYLDLDQFKRINDTLGHTAGDKLLQSIAKNLLQNVRANDIIGRESDSDSDSDSDSEPDIETAVSRLGGDEFAILLSKVADPSDAGQVAKRILRVLPTPVASEHGEMSTTASIGIAIYPGDGEDAETLIKHADAALYSAKDRGRNNFQFFSHQLNEGARRRLSLEANLRHALDRNQLKLLYQPRVDLQHGMVLGFEALLRWTHPELGAIQPNEFIPVAEATGMIVPIGEWVLRTACTQMKAWEEAGYTNVCLSVNVSTRQFANADLANRIASVMQDTGIDPRNLEIEITESAVLYDNSVTDQVLRDLKAMGVSISLDDFGTGYSSLSYLSRFPLDRLKLDRTLVREVTTNPAASGIVTAVIAMAHALEMTVVAEGVDEEDQAVFLRANGCDEMQGFLISGAVAPEECLKLIDQRGMAKR